MKNQNKIEASLSTKIQNRTKQEEVDDFKDQNQVIKN